MREMPNRDGPCPSHVLPVSRRHIQATLRWTVPRTSGQPIEIGITILGGGAIENCANQDGQGNAQMKPRQARRRSPGTTPGPSTEAASWLAPCTVSGLGGPWTAARGMDL